MSLTAGPADGLTARTRDAILADVARVGRTTHLTRTALIATMVALVDELDRDWAAKYRELAAAVTWIRQRDGV